MSWIRAVLLALALVIGYRIVPALLSAGSPPAACQLTGGHWSLWSGWRCALYAAPGDPGA
jgi:hypothetical protein